MMNHRVVCLRNIQKGETPFHSSVADVGSKTKLFRWDQSSDIIMRGMAVAAVSPLLLPGFLFSNTYVLASSTFLLGEAMLIHRLNLTHLNEFNLAGIYDHNAEAESSNFPSSD
jgi:hypothetical protein